MNGSPGPRDSIPSPPTSAAGPTYEMAEEATKSTTGSKGGPAKAAASERQPGTVDFRINKGAAPEDFPQALAPHLNNLTVGCTMSKLTHEANALASRIF